MLTNLLKRTTHTYFAMMKNFSVDHEWPVNLFYSSGPLNNRVLQIITYPCVVNAPIKMDDPE